MIMELQFRGYLDNFIFRDCISIANLHTVVQYPLYFTCRRLYLVLLKCSCMSIFFLVDIHTSGHVHIY